MKKLFLAALLVLSCVGFLGQAAFVSPAWAAAQATTADIPKAVQEGTGTVKFEDEAFIVYIGEITKDEKGNTTVQLVGDKIRNRALLRNGKMVLPVWMDIVVAGKTISADNCNVGSVYTYYFETTQNPKEIIVYGNDNKRSSQTFDGKTRKIINK
jgi:hypothetical protein